MLAHDARTCVVGHDASVMVLLYYSSPNYFITSFFFSFLKDNHQKHPVYQSEFRAK